MLPSRHIIVSFSLGAIIVFYTKSLFAGMLCLFSGVLIDIDHLIDYLAYHGFNTVNPREIYHGCRKLTNSEQEGGVKKIYFILHAGEFAILLWIGFGLSKNIYLLALALGYTGHLMMDMAANSIIPSAYFLTTRIKNNFRTVSYLRSR